eukprot:6807633-Ditylum_brightwellii.AAC.1
MVMDLKYLDNHEETMHAVNEASKIDRKGLTVNAVRKLVNLSRDAKDGHAPQTTNHCQALNPYESLYGSEWKKKVEESVAMKKM